MYTVLAREEIRIAAMNQRQALAAAERKRLIDSAANASERRSTSAVALRRVRDGLSAAVGALVGVRAGRSVPRRDGAAAYPPA